MNEVFYNEHEKVVGPLIARTCEGKDTHGKVMKTIASFVVPFWLDREKNPIAAQFDDVSITAAKIELATAFAFKLASGRDKESYLLVKNVCSAVREAPKGEKIAAAKEEFDDLAKPMIESMFKEFYEQFIDTLLGKDEDKAIDLLNYLEKYTKC